MKQRRRLTPEQWAARQRRRRRWLLVVSAAVLAALVVADRFGLLLQPRGDWSRYHGRTCRVVHVVDGDTLHIDMPDAGKPYTIVRLWGVDAPETAKAWLNEPAEPLAGEAAALARRLADGQLVTLALQQHELRDLHGRIVAYVTLPDGSSLNEQLILAGLATADERFPHEQVDRYRLLEAQARHDGRGLWAEDDSD